MSVDLSNLSPQDLESLIADAQKLRVQKLRENMVDVRRRLRDAAKAEGYSIEELFGTGSARGGKTHLPPKFANPADPGHTWSGRGKRPGWFKDALAKGTKAEAMAV